MGRSVELSFDQWRYLKSLNVCHYCGKVCFNGIDRIDNSLAYTWENSIPACKRCNMSKNNMPVHRLLAKLHYPS